MLKDKLLNCLKSDTDFKEYSSILEEVVDSVELYLLDKKYLDELIIDLGSIYELVVLFSSYADFVQFKNYKYVT